MLNRQDREAIEGLFDRLAEAGRQGTPRDAEAEALIEEEMARVPSAGYYMAQTIVVQQQGLEAAERRIAELESELERKRGQFDDSRESRRRGPWDRAPDAGGGFLAGAMQTAMGVAGGVLLGSAIGSLLGGHPAQAADHAQGTAEPDPADTDADFGDGDAGGDFDGGFDIGGDF